MYLYSYLYTLPTTTDLLSDLGDVSEPFFADLLPVVVFVAGLTIAIGILSFLLSKLAKAFGK